MMMGFIVLAVLVAGDDGVPSRAGAPLRFDDVVFVSTKIGLGFFLFCITHLQRRAAVHE